MSDMTDLPILTPSEGAKLAKAVAQRTPGKLRARNGGIEIAVTRRRSRLLFAPVGAPYADAHAFVTMGNNFANMLDTIADFYHTSGDLCPKCSWRGERGNGCEFCALVEARAVIADLCGYVDSLETANDELRLDVDDRVERIDQQYAKIAAYETTIAELREQAEERK